MAQTTARLAVAVDLTHHLSELSKRRQTSPLKGLQKYFMKPGTLQLAGGASSSALSLRAEARCSGTPDPSYFPFASLGGQAMASDSFSVADEKALSGGAFSWLWNIFGASKDKTTEITVPRFPTTPGALSLAEMLQYGETPVAVVGSHDSE